MKLINREWIEDNICLEDLIEPVADAFRLTSQGKATNGYLLMYPLENKADGDVVVKTATVSGRSVYVVKVAPWFASNVKTGQPQGGFVAVCESATGHTLALIDDQHLLSDLRTAAAGALAARHLAPKTIDVAAVLGTGVQGFWQSLALFRERPFNELRVWGRTLGKAEKLAEKLKAELPSATIMPVSSAEEAVRNSDVIITATLAREPIIEASWLRPGQHITAIGADDPSKCEIHPEALQAASVFVDARTAMEKNGNLVRATHTANATINTTEIGDVINGNHPGRTSSHEITIATFIGIGAQDLVTAEVVAKRAI